MAGIRVREMEKRANMQFVTAFYYVKVLMISKLNVRGVAIAPACTFAAHTKVRAVTCQFVAKCLPDT